MADTPKKQTTSAIPAPEPTMTLWQARRRVGWMSTIDFVFMWIAVLIGVGTAAWCIFGWPTVSGLIGVGLGTIIYLLLWLILLVYRSMLFTLGVHADIQMMPVEAARMAAAHITGLHSKQDEHPDVAT